MDLPEIKPTSFVLVQDEDCHWFVIPAARADEWDGWCQDVAEDMTCSLELPCWAERVNGAASRVEFSGYVIK